MLCGVEGCGKIIVPLQMNRSVALAVTFLSDLNKLQFPETHLPFVLVDLSNLPDPWKMQKVPSRPISPSQVKALN